MGKEEGIKMRMNAPFQWFTLESRWVEDTSRLDASFYSQDVMKARILIEHLRKGGIEIRKIGDQSISKKFSGQEDSRENMYPKRKESHF